MSLKDAVKSKIGLRETTIFSEDTSPPYSNPYNYPLNNEGIPIVPKKDVISGGFIGERKVFSGGFIVNSSQNSFVVRTEMGAKTVREGDLFAFENKNPDGRPLVFEVIQAESNKTGAYSIKTKDIGFLKE